MGGLLSCACRDMFTIYRHHVGDKGSVAPSAGTGSVPPFTGTGTREPLRPAGVLRESRRMAYDVDLSDRAREALRAEPGVSERRMFGGLAFLVGGHMAVAASSHGGLLLRVDPQRTDEYLDEPHVG